MLASTSPSQKLSDTETYFISLGFLNPFFDDINTNFFFGSIGPSRLIIFADIRTEHRLPSFNFAFTIFSLYIRTRVYIVSGINDEGLLDGRGNLTVGQQ